MPPKGYSNITVRTEVRDELEKLRKELGFRDFSDLLVFLVRCYRQYTSISSKLDELLTRVSSITATSNSSKDIDKLLLNAIEKLDKVITILQNTNIAGKLDTILSLLQKQTISASDNTQHNTKQGGSTESSTAFSTAKQDNSTSRYRKKYYKKQYEDDSWVLQYAPEGLENR